MQWFGFGADGTGAMNNGFYPHTFGAGFLRVLFSFFAGVLVYRLWLKWRRAITIPPMFIAIPLIAILAARPSVILERPYDLIATIVLFPVIVMLGASIKANGRIAIFSILGVASYGIYVLQAPLYA